MTFAVRLITWQRCDDHHYSGKVRVLRKPPAFRVIGLSLSTVLATSTVLAIASVSAPAAFADGPGQVVRVSGTGEVVATCPDGSHAVGGGFEKAVNVLSNRPTDDGRGWTVHADAYLAKEQAALTEANRLHGIIEGHIPDVKRDIADYKAWLNDPKLAHMHPGYRKALARSEQYLAKEEKEKQELETRIAELEQQIDNGAFTVYAVCVPDS